MRMKGEEGWKSRRTCQAGSETDRRLSRGGKRGAEEEAEAGEEQGDRTGGASIWDLGFAAARC